MRGISHIVLLCLILVPAVAWAGMSQNLTEAVQSVERIEEGKQTWRSSDITKNISSEDVAKLRRDASTGDAGAQARLGLCYHLGFGVPRSSGEAANWYEKAVTRNHSGAQNNLALLYDVGAGMSEDRGKAHQLYLAAAIQGLPQAQFNLGINCAEGWAVKQSWREAKHWYEKAAEQGNLPAMSNLGNIHLLGRGVPVDLEMARKLLQKPAEVGLAIAQFSLAVSYSSQRDFAAASPWMKKSAEGGFVSAQYYWAISLMEGIGVDRNLDEALKWARLCVSNTAQNVPKLLPDAQALLAQVLMERPGVGEAEAYQMARASAEAEAARGQFLVGLCCYRGTGTARDPAAAITWYRKAADQGMADAAAVLGSAYESGDGVGRNLGEAFRWYKEAVRGGNGPICMRVGTLLLEGNGIQRSLDEAGKCFQRILDFHPNDGRALKAREEVERRKKGGAGEETFQKGLETARSAEDGKATMAEAIQLLSEAAEKYRNQRAAATLATIYRRGLGVPKDPARADQLIGQIGETTDRAVLYQMAVGFLPSGKVPWEVMDARALEWLRRSASDGYAAAQSALGLYLMSTPDGVRDPVEAMKWLILSGMEAYPAGRVNAEKLRTTMSFPELEEAKQRARAFSVVVGPASAVATGR